MAQSPGCSCRDLGLIPSTTCWCVTVCNSSSWKFDALFWPPWAHVQVVHTEIKKKKWNIFLHFLTSLPRTGRLLLKSSYHVPPQPVTKWVYFAIISNSAGRPFWRIQVEMLGYCFWKYLPALPFPSVTATSTPKEPPIATCPSKCTVPAINLGGVKLLLIELSGLLTFAKHLTL